MNNTMVKIITLCERVLSESNSKIEVLKAKTIISKAHFNSSLTKWDLDFITEKQIEYGI